ncbi:hypothetical protein [Streptomyces beigongshangae]|uniref:hypothetical protein n=1 Tax=Streptomyces beigongshangae TaxID=2841597 RepID=UPI001C848375|nr:hypothetical protein [Streptomyces sp. REN17]
MSRKKGRPVRDAAPPSDTVTQTLGIILDKAMASWSAVLRLTMACIALCLPVAAAVTVYLFLH